MYRTLLRSEVQRKQHPYHQTCHVCTKMRSAALKDNITLMCTGLENGEFYVKELLQKVIERRNYGSRWLLEQNIFSVVFGFYKVSHFNTFHAAL